MAAEIKRRNKQFKQLLQSTYQVKLKDMKINKPSTGYMIQISGLQDLEVKDVESLKYCLTLYNGHQFYGRSYISQSKKIQINSGLLSTSEIEQVWFHTNQLNQVVIEIILTLSNGTKRSGGFAVVMLQEKPQLVTVLNGTPRMIESGIKTRAAFTFQMTELESHQKPFVNQNCFVGSHEIVPGTDSPTIQLQLHNLAITTNQAFEIKFQSFLRSQGTFNQITRQIFICQNNGWRDDLESAITLLQPDDDNVCYATGSFSIQKFIQHPLNAILFRIEYSALLETGQVTFVLARGVYLPEMNKVDQRIDFFCKAEKGWDQEIRVFGHLTDGKTQPPQITKPEKPKVVQFTKLEEPTVILSKPTHTVSYSYQPACYTREYKSDNFCSLPHEHEVPLIQKKIQQQQQSKQRIKIIEPTLQEVIADTVHNFLQYQRQPTSQQQLLPTIAAEQDPVNIQTIRKQDLKLSLEFNDPLKSQVISFQFKNLKSHYIQFKFFTFCQIQTVDKIVFEIDEQISQYLFNKELSIEVYDLQSRFLIGLSKLPLFMLLRQGLPLIERTWTICHQISVVFSNQGRYLRESTHKIKSSQIDLSRLQGPSNPMNLVHCPDPVTTLKQVLHSQPVVIQDRRQQRVHNALNKVTPASIDSDDPYWLKVRSLKAIQACKVKPSKRILFQQGQPNVVILTIQNNHTSAEMFSIQSEFQLVTNHQEVQFWKSFKQFNQKFQTDLELAANEQAHFLMKYQSFEIGDKHIQVKVMSQGKVYQQNDYDITVTQAACDQTYRFYKPAGLKFEVVIPFEGKSIVCHGLDAKVVLQGVLIQGACKQPMTVQHGVLFGQKETVSIEIHSRPVVYKRLSGLQTFVLPKCDVAKKVKLFGSGVSVDSDVFIMIPGIETQVQVMVSSDKSGEGMVNCVDQGTGELVYAWLVVMDCVKQQI